MGSNRFIHGIMDHGPLSINICLCNEAKIIIHFGTVCMFDQIHHLRHTHIYNYIEEIRIPL